MNPFLVIGYYIGIALLFALLAFIGEIIFYFPARAQNKIPTYSFKFGAIAALFTTFYRFELLSGQKFDFWILALPIATIIIGEFLGQILQAMLGYSVRETFENMSAVDEVFESKDNGIFKSIAKDKTQTVIKYHILTQVFGLLSSSGIMVFPLLLYFLFKQKEFYNSILFFSFLTVYCISVLSNIIKDFKHLYLSPEFNLEYKTYRLVEGFRKSVQISSMLILFNSLYFIYIDKGVDLSKYAVMLPVALFGITIILPYLIGIKVTKHQIEKNTSKLIEYASEIKNALSITDANAQNNKFERLSTRLNEDFDDTKRRDEYNNRYYEKYEDALFHIENKNILGEGNNYIMKFSLSQNLLLQKAMLRINNVFPNVMYCVAIARMITYIDSQRSELKENLVQNWLDNFEKQKIENQNQKNPIGPLVTSVFTGVSGYIIKLFDDNLVNTLKSLIK